MKNFFFSYRSYTPIPIVILLVYFSSPSRLFVIFGIVLVFLGECIRIKSVQYAGGITRTTKVGAPSLCTSGPYARTRNPLYLGNMIIYSGITFIAGGPYLEKLLFMVLLYFTFQYSMIISLEEQTLKNLFPNDYKNYMVNVPRLFPRIRPWPSNDTRAPISIKKTLATERRTLQNIFLMITIFMLKACLKS